MNTARAKTVTRAKAPAEKIDGIDREKLHEIESLAVELAGIAGAEIAKTLGGLLAVRYKTAIKDDVWRDPVSEVDHEVEAMIRERLARLFR
jgi:myo-inositol-1(or 4)-monophosphatase